MTVAVRNRQRRHRVPTARLRLLASQVARRLRLRHRELSIALISDGAMTQLNARYHGGTGSTDILTFDYGEAAELVISVDRALAHARRFCTTPRRELARYVVHGLLHLAGWDDQTAAARRRMRAAERRLLRECLGPIWRGA